MGDYQCSRCNLSFGMYYELRDHTAASHREDVTEKIVLRAGRAL